MYHPDLTYYRINLTEDEAIVYLHIKYIGWLDSDHSYHQGFVSNSLTEKLKELLFLDLKNSEEQDKRILKPNEAIFIHGSRTRGIHLCHLCNESSPIEVEPIDLKYYRGSKSMLVGINAVYIPSTKNGEFYFFPTMLHHYITEHNYKPPEEFLNSLQAFNLSKPFNIFKEEEKSYLAVKMPIEEVNSFNPSPELIADLLKHPEKSARLPDVTFEELFSDI